MSEVDVKVKLDRPFGSRPTYFGLVASPIVPSRIVEYC